MVAANDFADRCCRRQGKPELDHHLPRADARSMAIRICERARLVAPNPVSAAVALAVNQAADLSGIG